MATFSYQLVNSFVSSLSPCLPQSFSVSLTPSLHLSISYGLSYSQALGKVKWGPGKTQQIPKYVALTWPSWSPFQVEARAKWPYWPLLTRPGNPAFIHAPVNVWSLCEWNLLDTLLPSLSLPPSHLSLFLSLSFSLLSLSLSLSCYQLQLCVLF